ncbi:WG repeat-containing protein [Bacteroides acidifaciens]|uniref:WG repeat-containing protein n=1 Tax=Bacteroides acidifaciens TaxID=85831 RepID=UPI0026EDD744|nr:WG repeat-containing protein [Bacteroides acidifaciens]
MKKLVILTVIVLLCFQTSLAQKFEIQKVEANTFNLEASISPRLSLNGEPCALVIFEVTSPNAKFQGNIVGDISYETGEYRVFVSPGTKEIKVLHDRLTPLKIYFPDYKIASLDSKQVYTVSLILPFDKGSSISDGNRLEYLYQFRDEKTGYIGLKNPLDEIVVEAKYEGVELFNDDGYIVVVQNDKVGIINLYGKTLLPCEYDMPITPCDSLVVCSKNDKWGIVDYHNNILLPFDYENISVYGGSHNNQVMSLKKGGKYSIAKMSDFKPSTAYLFDKIEAGRMLFDNGIVAIENPHQSKLFAVKVNDKWGFINEQGIIVIKPQYEEGEDYRNRIFVNGTAAVCKNGKYGIINEKGEVVAPFKFNRIFMQLNDAPNVYYFAIDNEGYEIFSTLGEKITKRHYQELDLCSDGMTSFKENGKCGVIDLSTGEDIVPAIYDEVHSYGFGEGKVMVKKNEKWGCINRNGSEVFGFHYDDVYGYSNGIARVKKDGKWGLIKSNGLYLIPCEYQEVTYMGDDRLAGIRKDDGKWALVNLKGIIVTPFIYDDVHYHSIKKEGQFLRGVRKDGKYGCVDYRGEEVIPCVYHEDEIEGQIEKYIRERSI